MKYSVSVLFLNIEKFLIPKQTRFNTFVLLLQPSVKPLEYGTSKLLRIYSDQLCIALVQALNSGKSLFSAWYSHKPSRSLAVAESEECMNSRK